MPFAVILAPEAVEDLKRLSASVRATVRSALEKQLWNEPEKASRSRIKRLRGIRRPQYRLRMDEVGVFSDASGTAGEGWAIGAKSEAGSWRRQLAGPGG